MAVLLTATRDKRIDEVRVLHERAKKWVKEMDCRKCGSTFTFDATDLAPGRGAYGGPEFFEPQIHCPSCGTLHWYWLKIRLFNRWIGKYLGLRYELREIWQPPENEERRGGRVIQIR